MDGGVLEELDEDRLPFRIEAGALTEGIAFTLPPAIWSDYAKLQVTIDEPDGDIEWGAAQECDEDDNFAIVDLSDFCI